MTLERYVPSVDEWGDLSDRDVYYAYGYFGGKTNEETLDMYRKNVIERVCNLESMPIKVFNYYIFGLKKYVDMNQDENFDLADSAYGFVCVVHEKSHRHPREVRAIYPELESLLAHVCHEQDRYGVDMDIYGDLEDKLREIKNALN